MLLMTITTHASTDTRLTLLHHWVGEQLGQPCTLRPLEGDAGARRYFSLDKDDTLLAVDASPATENSAQFIYVAQLFTRHGVAVPAIQAADLEQGFLLVEYAREGLLAQRLDRENRPLLYGEALFKLLAIQQIDKTQAALPVFDEAFIQRELALCEEWFFNGLLGYSLTPAERGLLDTLFTQLIASALAQPQVVMHRDYHSRNLVFGRGGHLLTIDFQDAVIGPITYDLVSLLRDCYYSLPPQQVHKWALHYGDMALEADVLSMTSSGEFLQWFDWMGLQRHLKVLGIFSRLHLRDQKSAYLQDLPRVLGYIQQVLDDYPQLQAADWFHNQLMPRVRQQPWWPVE